MAWIKEHISVLALLVTIIFGVTGGGVWSLMFVYELGYNEGVDDTKLEHALIEIKNLKNPTSSIVEKKLYEILRHHTQNK